MKEKQDKIIKKNERGAKIVHIGGERYDIGLFPVLDGIDLMLQVQQLLMPLVTGAVAGSEGGVGNQAIAVASIVEGVSTKLAKDTLVKLLEVVSYKGSPILSILDAHEPIRKNLNIMFELAAEVIQANGFLDLDQGIAVTNMTGLKSETEPTK